MSDTAVIGGFRLEPTSAASPERYLNELAERLPITDNGSMPVQPRQIRKDVVVLSIWADVDDPAWLCAELDNPNTVYTIREANLATLPLTGEVSESRRRGLCANFFKELGV